MQLIDMLVGKIAHQLRKPGFGIKKQLALNKLYGLGKGLRTSGDAKKYMSRMRKGRVGPLLKS